MTMSKTSEVLKGQMRVPASFTSACESLSIYKLPLTQKALKTSG
jgi:hypothetical protein